MVAAGDLQIWPEGTNPSLLEGGGDLRLQGTMVSVLHSAGRHSSVLQVTIKLVSENGEVAPAALPQSQDQFTAPTWQFTLLPWDLMP